MMTYSIEIKKQGDYLYKAVVKVLEGEDVLLEGETLVGCETEQQAYDYAEKVFLPDLRRNYPREIGNLELPIDSIPDPEPQEVIPDDTVPV